MSVLTGNNLRVYSAGSPIGYATTCTLDLQTEFIDLAPTNISDAEWRTVLPRRMSGTVSVSALYSEDSAKVRFEGVFSNLTSQTSVNLTVQSSGFVYSGTAYPESISLNAGASQIASWTATFIFSGDITKTIL